MIVESKAFIAVTVLIGSFMAAVLNVSTQNNKLIQQNQEIIQQNQQVIVQNQKIIEQNQEIIIQTKALIVLNKTMALKPTIVKPIEKVEKPKKKVELTKLQKVIEYGKKFPTKDNEHIIVVDYFKNINEKRMFVIDRNTGKTVYSTYVSHGSGSGRDNLKEFSNVPGSFKSSVGVMSASFRYVGKNGESIKLNGLEKDFNDNVFKRFIVLHKSWYMTPDRKGHFGHSKGCLSVSKGSEEQIFKYVKDGTIIVVMGPDDKWWDKVNEEISKDN